MGKLSYNVIEQFISEMQHISAEIETERLNTFITICDRLKLEKPATHARQHGIPRYIVCALNVHYYYRLSFGELVDVLPFHLFEDNSVMFSWGRSETDNVLKFKLEPLPLSICYKTGELKGKG